MRNFWNGEMQLSAKMPLNGHKSYWNNDLEGHELIEYKMNWYGYKRLFIEYLYYYLFDNSIDWKNFCKIKSSSLSKISIFLGEIRMMPVVLSDLGRPNVWTRIHVTLASEDIEPYDEGADKSRSIFGLKSSWNLARSELFESKN